MRFLKKCSGNTANLYTRRPMTSNGIQNKKIQYNLRSIKPAYYSWWEGNLYFVPPIKNQELLSTYKYTALQIHDKYHRMAD
jgi:hypothetical protein